MGGGGAHDKEPGELGAIDGGQGALNEVILGGALLVLDVLHHGDDLGGRQVHRVEPAEANAGERDSMANVQNAIRVLSNLETIMEGRVQLGVVQHRELNQVMNVVTVALFCGCQTCTQYASMFAQTENGCERWVVLAQGH